MTSVKKKYGIVASFLRIGFILLVGFLPFYLPLRFQTGLISEIPIALFGVMVILVFLTYIHQSLKPERLTKMDVLIGIFALYSLVLLIFSDWGVVNIILAIRLFIIPVFLYYVISFNFGIEDNHKLLYVFLLSITITSVFYILEFYNYVILNQGYFEWTERMREYTISNQGLGGISESWIYAGSAVYVRLAGFIGHNHATGFFVGFGSIGWYLLGNTNKKNTILWYVLALVSAIAMIISMSRTAIFAIGFGWVLLLFFLKHKIKKTLIGIFFIVMTIALLSFLFNYEADIVKDAALQIFSKEQIGNTINILINIPDIEKYYSQIITYPLSFFTGIGLSPTQSVPPVLSDDIYFIQLLSEYGVFGIGLLGCIIAFSIKYSLRCIKVDRKSIFVSLTPLLYILTIIITTGHSSVLARIQLFPIFFVMMGIINSNYRSLFLNNQ